jgi:hypothetical protein
VCVCVCVCVCARACLLELLAAALHSALVLTLSLLYRTSVTAILVRRDAATMGLIGITAYVMLASAAGSARLTLTSAPRALV